MAAAPVSDESRAHETTLRRKEKELEKKESQITQSTAELNAARDSVDFLMQELEARELVMNEAEEKHGSLLRREEDVARREREVTDQERAVGIRIDEVNRKDEQFEELERNRQKDYEDKLFPLAAREQEIIRREGEVHSLETELESKMRTFSRKMAVEEERDRQRDKANKEHEAKLKEYAASVDKRHGEAENLLNMANEKQKAVKAEQIEVESRDRDVKWRDDQLRIAHQDVHDTKIRLMKWEQQVALREEELNVMTSELQLQKTTLESKELELGERLSKVLSAEKEVKLREDEATGRLDRVENLESVATKRINSTQEREAKILADTEAVESKYGEAERLVAEASEKEKSAAQLLKEVQDKERALKDWIIELDYKEKQLNTKLASGSGSNAAGRGGTSPTPQQQPSKINSASLASMSLRQVQDRYLGANAKQSAKLAAKREQKRQAVDLASVEDPFVARAEELIALRELHVECRALEKEFGDWVGRYYCIPNERLGDFFSGVEQQQFATMLDSESRFDEEDSFLTVIIGDSARSNSGETGGSTSGSSVVPKTVNFSTVEEWQLYQKKICNLAIGRRKDLLSTRVSRLSSWNEIFKIKEETHPRDFPKQPRSILNAGSAEDQSVITHRIHRRAPRPTNETNPSTKKKLRTLIDDDHNDDEAVGEGTYGGTRRSTIGAKRSGSETRRGTMIAGDSVRQPHSAYSAQARQDATMELSKIVESLPPYLRHHYTKDGNANEDEDNSGGEDDEHRSDEKGGHSDRNRKSLY